MTAYKLWTSISSWNFNNAHSLTDFIGRAGHFYGNDSNLTESTETYWKSSAQRFGYNDPRQWSLPDFPGDPLPNSNPQDIKRKSTKNIATSLNKIIVNIGIKYQSHSEFNSNKTDWFWRITLSSTSQFSFPLCVFKLFEVVYASHQVKLVINQSRHLY